MKKKIFGIKIGTILYFFACFLAAVIFWLYVKYTESYPLQSSAAFAFDLWSVL